MYIADLHIHSKYSRATSGDCVPELLDVWARKKGIGLVGTGDFTHPAWRAELKEKLVPAEEGLYILREDCRREGGGADAPAPRFVVTGEISTIYKKNDRVRKVHSLILLPGLEEAEAVSRRLEAVGNLHSDGRPILGLDCRDLLELILEACPGAVFIPAHIWTPHFSLFGAFSGFDTMEECFEDMTPHIRAVETGLSSDPPMNWRLSALDGMALVSNSDAHSPAKLGREANLLDTELSYPALRAALDGRNAAGLMGTIEFFPEEGKYHFDGHRNCGVCLKPIDAEAAGGLCPVCGKRLTVGVLHRVEQLADRKEGFTPPEVKSYESLIPLPEVLGACTGHAAGGARVHIWYEEMLRSLGSEFHILRQAPVEDIERLAGPCVAEGIRRMRAGKVNPVPGFDGEYGKIGILSEEERDALAGQLRFFPGGEELPAPRKKAAPKKKAPPLREERSETAAELHPETGPLAGLNDEQKAAATATEPAVAVVAGPGTGKTKTLVARIIWLVEQAGVDPAEITAVTFTNKAAAEMRARLEGTFGSRKALKGMTIGTFHSVCLERLRAAGREVLLLDEEAAASLAAEAAASLEERLSPRKLLAGVSRLKNGGESGLPDGAAEAYAALLRRDGVMDFDDLLLEGLALAASPEGAAPEQRRAFRHLLVDEFQDINPLQYRLVSAWSRDGEGLFVIGDPDQAIYGFRGADARCFDRLREDKPALRLVRLTKNYRSAPAILRCALAAVAPNPAPQGGRALEPQRDEGGRPGLITAADDLPEGIFVAKEINRLVGGMEMVDTDSGAGREKPLGFSDIAVLYRAHRQAQVLEKCLRRDGIPYVVTGREPVLAEPAIRGTAGFFRFLLNPRDAVSLRTALTTIFGCPAALARGFAAGEKLPPLPPEMSEGLRKWEALAASYGPRVRREKPRRLLEDWAADSGLAGTPAMERLLGMAVFHSHMDGFLTTLLLGGEGDVSRSGGKRAVPDAVSLMTLHGAKGLEFPVVFLCGVKKGVLPLEAPGRTGDPEEERRLLYVGMTRARDELLLLTGPEPSPFLEDIPGDWLARSAAGPREPSAGKQLSLFD